MQIFPASIRKVCTARFSLFATSTAVACLFWIAGCSGGSSNSAVSAPPGLPTPPAVAASNAYTGTQDPGLWSLTLNDQQSTFSYQVLASGSGASTIPAGTPVLGSTAQTNGFLTLTTGASTPAGYALEIPGRLAFLRPGDSTAALVAAVPSTTCLAINGYVTLDFISLTTNIDDVNFGQVVASTSSDGKSYTFGNQAKYHWGNLPDLVLDQNNSYPDIISGSCATSGGVAAITLPVNTQNPVSPTILLGPTGFFVEDQTGVAIAQDSLSSSASLVGLAEPLAPLSAADLAGQPYVGFSSSTLNSGVTATHLVSFGPASSPGSLSGGAFSNDDPTLTAANNITITFGSESSTLNGFYYNATVTEPDPLLNCVLNSTGKAGLDANGNPICTSPAAAVVGNPEGKYAIFVAEVDDAVGGYVGYYLLQQ